uniref:Uncharacterized protein n=1 Tax=Physcomitrium patens TaxID=3218 RepID=A0A2K1IK58_PHYPA|nr:hypothetical protein PHYPA_028353 [Physcomitrium patens]
MNTLLELDLEGFSNQEILPQNMHYLTSLRIVNLKRYTSWSSNLTSLPSKLWDFKFLTRLNISRCLNLISLPKKLDNLTSLTDLDINE